MIIQGDALHIPLRDESVQCCVTSPPYYGLRDYGIEGQLGLESAPEEYIEKMVAVFREVKRVLKRDGLLWLNIGDSYWGGKGKSNLAFQARRESSSLEMEHHNIFAKLGSMRPTDGKHETIKPKDLIGIPWMLAFALRGDGWFLRQDIIWHKPNPMPESVTDRCTKAHEYVFLLSKSSKYFYNNDAIKEPIKDSSIARLIQDVENQKGSEHVVGKTNGNMKAVRFGGNKQCPDTRLQSGKEWNPKMNAGGTSFRGGHSNYFNKDGVPICGVMANKKSVWSIATQSYSGSHFATFPEKLVEPMILAGSRPGDVVLDPFSGSGTTGLVAERHRRRYVGVELNMDYIGLAKKRLSRNQIRLFA